MESRKLILRAFEAFKKPTGGCGEGLWVFHFIGVDATSKGTARKGSPFVHHRITTPYSEMATLILSRAANLSTRLEEDDLTLDRALFRLPTRKEMLKLHSEEHGPKVAFPEQMWTCKTTSMTFAIEAAAQKFLRRAVMSEFGGDNSVITLYEGPLSIDGLKGRASVSPFNKDMMEVEENVDLFTGVDNSFRARRLRKQRSKKRAKAVQAELSPGEVMIRAHHPSRKSRLIGEVTGYQSNLPLSFKEARGYMMGGEVVDGEWKDVLTPLTGELFVGTATTDCNMFTTIKTVEAAKETWVVWTLPSGEEDDLTIVGVSEGEKCDDHSIKNLVNPKL